MAINSCISDINIIIYDLLLNPVVSEWAKGDIVSHANCLNA